MKTHVVAFRRFGFIADSDSKWASSSRNLHTRLRGKIASHAETTAHLRAFS